jgi:hypothetical protein
MANYDIGTATGATNQQIATAIKGVVDSGLDSAGIVASLQGGGSSYELKSYKNTDTVIFLGTSIMYLMTNGYVDYFKRVASNKNINVTTALTYAVSGSMISGSQSQWNTIKSTYFGRSNVLVVIESMVNEYLDRYHSDIYWDDLTALEKQEIFDEYEALIKSIEENGNRCLICNNNFVSPDGVADEDENMGAKPYYDNIIKPLAKRSSISWYDDDFRVNLYPFSYYNRDYFEFDGVHPLEGRGLPAQRAYLFESVCRVINGEPPLTNCYTNAKPQRCIFGFGSPDTDFKTKESKNSNRVMMITRDNTYTALPYQLTGIVAIPYDSFVPNSIRVDVYYDNSTVFSTAAAPEVAYIGDDDSGILCSNATSKAMYVTDTTQFITVCKIYGMNPNQTGAVYIRSIYPENTVTTKWTGQLSTNGGETYKVATAAQIAIASSGVSVYKLDFECDNDGAFEISAKGVVNGCLLNSLMICPE